MKRFIGLLWVGSLVVSVSAKAASLATTDADGKATSVEYALDDVRCRYDGKKLSIVTGGEDHVQLLTSVGSFEILPSTRAWKGTTAGNGSDTMFQDAKGGRWTSGPTTRCEIALERDATETKIELQCGNLVDYDGKSRELRHVVAKKLVCANARVAAR